MLHLLKLIKHFQCQDEHFQVSHYSKKQGTLFKWIITIASSSKILTSTYVSSIDIVHEKFQYLA